jgi:hypothetical protein
MSVESMIGSVVKSIDIDESNDDCLITLEDGRKFKIEHFQDCCETVQFYDASGDVHSLIGKKLTNVTEDYNDDPIEEDLSCDGSHTWSVYKFQTDENTVILRWYGDSNGYYSETTQLYEVK